MQAAKIIIGALLLIGGLGNIPGAMEMPNPRQAAGYMIPTIFFILLGGWLLYSGIRRKPVEAKIFDRSEIDSGSNE